MIIYNLIVLFFRIYSLTVATNIQLISFRAFVRNFTVGVIIVHVGYVRRACNGNSNFKAFTLNKYAKIGLFTMYASRLGSP